MPFHMNHWVKKARKAAKNFSVTRRDRLPGSFFSLSLIFSKIVSWGRTEAMSTEQVRLKTILLLRLDGINRSADLASIVRSSLTFTQTGVDFDMWWTKESKLPVCAKASINHYHARPLICTPCCVKVFLGRLPPPEKVVPTLDVRAEEGVATVCSPALFVRLSPRKDGFFTPLTSQSLSKIVKNSFPSIGIDVNASWRSHDFRGAASSKLYNLDFAFSRISERARWTNFFTFRQHYLRKKTYRRKPANSERMSLEAGLRYDSDLDIDVPVSASNKRKPVLHAGQGKVTDSGYDIRGFLVSSRSR